MKCKIVKIQKFMWRNIMRSTKSQKTSVLHYSILINWLELRNLEFSQIRTSKSTRSWPKVKKPRIIQSPIRIWIPACTLVGISTINFDPIIRLSWFKLRWKSDMMGYKYVSNDHFQIRMFSGSKRARNQSLQIN